MEFGIAFLLSVAMFPLKLVPIRESENYLGRYDKYTEDDDEKYGWKKMTRFTELCGQFLLIVDESVLLIGLKSVNPGLKTIVPFAVRPY